MMNLNQKRRDAALTKELLAVEKQEKKMQQTALKAKPAAWKTELESRIPAGCDRLQMLSALYGGGGIRPGQIQVSHGFAKNVAFEDEKA